MNNENPWLEVIKQNNNYPNKPELTLETFTLEFPTGWVAEQERQFKNLLLYGTTHPEIEFIVEGERYPSYSALKEAGYELESMKEDTNDEVNLQCADSIINYFNKDEDLIEFADDLRIDYDMDTNEIRSVWRYLKSGEECGEPVTCNELLEFLYEEGIWER